MKQAELKTRVITFRVRETVWQEATERALLSGKSLTEWARDEIVERLDEQHGMTPGERLMYVEVNNIRHLVEKLMLVAMNADNEEEVAEALEQSIDHREAAARDYFAQLAEVGARWEK